MPLSGQGASHLVVGGRPPSGTERSVVIYKRPLCDNFTVDTGTQSSGEVNWDNNDDSSQSGQEARLKTRNIMVWITTRYLTRVGL